MSEFIDRLASADPTPGGGAAAARAGELSCALLRMVVAVTVAKAPAEDDPEIAAEVHAAFAEARRTGERAARLQARFAELLRADMDAFESYLEALRRPRSSPEEKESRRAALRAAARGATEVPLATVEAALGALDIAGELRGLSERLRLRAESDVGVALELARAASRGAEFNVRVNLSSLSAEDRERFEAELVTKSAHFEARYENLRSSVLSWLG